MAYEILRFMKLNSNATEFQEFPIEYERSTRIKRNKSNL